MPKFEWIEYIQVTNVIETLEIWYAKQTTVKNSNITFSLSLILKIILNFQNQFIHQQNIFRINRSPITSADAEMTLKQFGSITELLMKLRADLKQSFQRFVSFSFSDFSHLTT